MYSFIFKQEDSTCFLQFTPTEFIGVSTKENEKRSNSTFTIYLSFSQWVYSHLPLAPLEAELLQQKILLLKPHFNELEPQ